MVLNMVGNWEECGVGMRGKLSQRAGMPRTEARSFILWTTGARRASPPVSLGLSRTHDRQAALVRNSTIGQPSVLGRSMAGLPGGRFVQRL